MRRSFILLVVVGLFITGLFYRTNDVRSIIEKIDKAGPGLKGELVYRVNFLGFIPVGEAVFEPEESTDYRGVKALRLKAKAKTLDFFSRLFNSYVEAESYVDARSLNPLLFRQKLVINGKSREEKEVSYDQDSGVMTMDGVRRQILADTQDPLSAIFNMRKMDFKEKKDFSLYINTNQKNYILKGMVYPYYVSASKRGREVFLLKTQISRIDKNPYHKSRISMIIIGENKNIPLLMKVFASGALVHARLIKIR
ncbi:MAG: DUF3108 domain-containing protein [Candidatus Omnitrophica bacterium]|nr:DUF3108 domain-containing protein [Candidatus Omnitrophota bacterium]